MSIENKSRNMTAFKHLSFVDPNVSVPLNGGLGAFLNEVKLEIPLRKIYLWPIIYCWSLLQQIWLFCYKLVLTIKIWEITVDKQKHQMEEADSII